MLWVILGDWLRKGWWPRSCSMNCILKLIKYQETKINNNSSKAGSPHAVGLSSMLHTCFQSSHSPLAGANPLNLFTLYKLFLKNEKMLFFTNIEGYSLNRNKMTKWIWPKLVNMTEKLTMTSVNLFFNYPLASKARREAANLTWRKIHTHLYMVSKNLSVCLLRILTSIIAT